MAIPIKSHYVKKKVNLSLVNGEIINCSFFTNGGELSVQDVLNDERQFIPVLVEEELKIINKSKIVYVIPL